MKHTYRLRAAALLAGLGVLLTSGGMAYAAPQAITITPTSLDQVIQPGATYDGSFQIVNQGKTGFTFHVYAAPYHVKGEEYTPDFTALPNAPKVVSWFNFSTQTAHIEPGQTSTINYTIKPPQNTPPGGYYATAFAETQYPKAANHITLNERVGEVFYLQVAGQVAKKGELLTWQSNLFQEPPLTSTIRLQNSGGVHYPATVQVSVKDIFGHSKYSLETVKEVLPQTIRKVTIPWNKTPSLGLFKVSGKVSFLDQHQTLSTKWVLVMSPAVRLFLIVIIALIIAFTTWRGIRRRRPHNKK